MIAKIFYFDCPILLLLQKEKSPVYAVLSLAPMNLSRASSGGDNQIVLTAYSLLSEIAVKALLSEIAVKAANSEGRKFAAGKKLDPGSEVVYGLAQCTPDLSKNDCRQCLVNATKGIEGRQRKILLPS